MKYLYRFYDVQYSAGCDEFGNDLGPGRVEVYIMQFPIHKETPCGAWIVQESWLSGPNEVPLREALKFVNLKANKKFACRTVAEAKESFLARKKRQIRILNSQIERAKKAIVSMESLNLDKYTPKGASSHEF